MSRSLVLCPCPNIQDSLNNNFLTCNSGMLREDMPILDWLTSPINSGALRTKVNPGKGKVRTVTLTHWQRLTKDQIQENRTNPSCTAETVRGNFCTDYTVDTEENVAVEEFITLDDWKDVCENNGEMYVNLIQRMIDGLMWKLWEKTAEQVAALVGAWGASVDNVVGGNLEVPTLKTGTTDEIFPFTMEDIDLAIRQSGYCANQAFFSGTLLYKYFRRILAGCCANQGVNLADIMRLYGRAIAYDREMATALGGNEFAIATQPSALVLLQYSKNEAWDDAEMQDLIKIGSDYHPRAIRDPKTGIIIDFNTKVSCGKIYLEMFATTKVVGMPDNLYDTVDEFNGVNFVNSIKVVNT